MKSPAIFVATLLMTVSALADEAALPTVNVTHRPVEGIGAEAGVMRRDPSDIIKVGDLYYVWYSKGMISPGYDATIWYATSKDGYTWTEKGMALAKGKPGSWEGASVFTPNILVSKGRYWLFYTGTSREYGKGFNPDSKIGIAVSDSPDGPWERLAKNPALKNSDDPNDFDSHLVDDACLITREGKYWFYYKGRQLGKSPGQTQMGLAIADHPEGPYVRHEANPVIPGNHEVLVWPQGNGVAAMIGTTGPKRLLIRYSMPRMESTFPRLTEWSMDRGQAVRTARKLSLKAAMAGFLNGELKLEERKATEIDCHSFSDLTQR